MGEKLQIHYCWGPGIEELCELQQSRLTRTRRERDRKKRQQSE